VINIIIIGECLPWCTIDDQALRDLMSIVVFSVASLYVYACNMIPGISGMDVTMNKDSERLSVVS